MLVKNQKYSLNIERLGSEAQGIGRIDNFTVFVEGALPDDFIEIVVIKVKKNYAVGKLLKIIKKSKNRVTPKCPIFNKCGGCTLQNLDYKEQLNYKQEKVYNDIKRIGGIETEVFKTIGMDEPYYYRNKAQFPVRSDKNNKPVIGFYKKRSHDIISVRECFIQHKGNIKIISVIEKFIIDYNISPYNEETNKGLIRHILTKVGFKTGEIMVCIVINGEKIPHEEKLIYELKKIEEIKSIVLNINRKQSNVILGDTVKLLWGREFINDILGDIKFKISPLSFYQVNPIQTLKLYKTVLDFAKLNGEEIILDAYCGVGSISLFMAKKSKFVYGIEIINQAIEDAKENAILNNINNVEFVTGSSEELIKKICNDKKLTPDIIIVDPPRKGCEKEVIDSILDVKPKKIIYVSCEPSTLARDLKIICENSYEIRKVQPVDCFCQTYHVETVVLMSRKDG